MLRLKKGIFTVAALIAFSGVALTGCQHHRGTGTGGTTDMGAGGTVDTGTQRTMGVGGGMGGPGGTGGTSQTGGTGVTQ